MYCFCYAYFVMINCVLKRNCYFISCLVHLSRHGSQVTLFAPDKPQMHVIDHLKGEVMEGETR